ncbi:MAG: hypothetical protein COA50_00150 [Flavobacteriaceae bacterium]|nr:MAG: hypothetical protein COA50_00150 [Flavobacteriaceae bacterium]
MTIKFNILSLLLLFLFLATGNLINAQEKNFEAFINRLEAYYEPLREIEGMATDGALISTTKQINLQQVN